MPKGNRGGVLNSSTRTRRPRPTTVSEQNARILEAASFKKSGRGIWDLAIPSSMGAATITDRTGSAVALQMGMKPAQKLYSMVYWDKEGNRSQTQYYPRLNDAKYYAKAAIQAMI